ncbi:hypothetical protein A0J48_007655 [Sphaerospermopsis aphanizomenoides BCCUSP55]|uniref:hypothetical protein n=1 Tax=Sphaerospermopsis aphanizomenoides TaxID=459663 RepID=UPI000A83A5FC|nr:hypothetical protein [Sphaerospermopsis aphanizomenoides]MBK1987412.1 hypothetical protein [Sphaerospermopsis aphanizomenoides BCCUSP55]
MNTESGIKLQQHKEAEINRTELYQKIDAGVKFAIANAIERHRRLGESISILRDGKVVTLTADEIPARDVDLRSHP